MMRKLAIAIGLFGAVAHADARADAEKLFADGRRAMESGDYPRACAKFEESNKVDPATGTQLNLAACWEKLGKNASAWAMYMQIASASSGNGRADRTQFAAARATVLLPMLSKLAITAPPSTSIRVDGAAWSAAVTGIATPVDPGHHTIDATLPGKPAFHRVVDVLPNATTVTVAVTF